MMQSAVSTVTGARKQRDRLAGGASKEQPGTCLCARVRACVRVCERTTLFLEFTLKEQIELRGTPESVDSAKSFL